MVCLSALLVQGQALTDINTLYSRPLMPLGYVVPALGRTGADLRAARGPHGLVATGPAARLGSLLPHLTTTTTQTTDGRPLEVRLPFLLALWLVLGCLTITDDVAILCVYEYMVGAERLGAALDTIVVSRTLALGASRNWWQLLPIA